MWKIEHCRICQMTLANPFSLVSNYIYSIDHHHFVLSLIVALNIAPNQTQLQLLFGLHSIVDRFSSFWIETWAIEKFNTNHWSSGTHKFREWKRGKHKTKWEKKNRSHQFIQFANVDCIDIQNRRTANRWKLVQCSVFVLDKNWFSLNFLDSEQDLTTKVQPNRMALDLISMSLLVSSNTLHNIPNISFYDIIFIVHVVLSF